MADTARFNEAAGLPKHVIEEIAQPDGSVRFFARARKGPFALAWEEIPVEWVNEQWFRHDRVFSAGPFRLLSATLRLEPNGANGATGHYTLEVEPANLFGALLLKTAFFGAVEKSFALLAASANDWAAGQREAPFDTPETTLAPSGRSRLDRVLARIVESPNDHGLSQRLADWILSAPEVDLARIRPIELARKWGAAEQDTIEMCLQAVKDGLLELRWDLLCPRCRGAKATVTSLDQLPHGAHCPSCNIDYDADFSRNVEMTFHPDPAIREIQKGEFCLFGPMSTPHVKVQISLNPGKKRDISACLAPGEYRVRTLEAGGEAEFTYAGGGFPATIIDTDAVTSDGTSANDTVQAENRTAFRRTLIVESRDWVADALIAERVTILQTFRDLFSHQILRPGDQVGISRVALLFTDLRGSTALYERVGDARAYGLVREHFAFLARVVRVCNGSVVKTIGDAVMAAFHDPADAVRAAIRVQQGVREFNRESSGENIVIKLGVHCGPCIAVTLSERFDYFGSTINMAARLQGESNGGDIVLSEDVVKDPAVAEMLAAYPLEAVESRFKGFDTPVSFLRLPASALTPPADAATVDGPGN
ncbi:MAG: adenylate/guanylate cyclase domain-containing protein [Alphaproteobacteria bacterium]